MIPEVNTRADQKPWPGFLVQRTYHPCINFCLVSLKMSFARGIFFCGYFDNHFCCLLNSWVGNDFFPCLRRKWAIIPQCVDPQDLFLAWEWPPEENWYWTVLFWEGVPTRNVKEYSCLNFFKEVIHIWKSIIKKCVLIMSNIILIQHNIIC